MTTRSLILSPHEVRAALNDRLGLVVRPATGLGGVQFTSVHFSSFHSIWGPDAWVFEASIPDGGVVSRGLQCSLGTTGTHLECKEPWARLRGQGFVFRAGYVNDLPEAPMRPKWRSPATMPSWASRITLELVGVRCVHVRELCIGKGFESMAKETWDAKYAKRGLGWEKNPWAWAVEVRRVDG